VTSEIVICACGCGATFMSRDAKGRLRRFCRGHWTRTPEGQRRLTGAPRPSQRGQWKKPSAHWRTSRYRARTSIDHTQCAWESIGHCMGAIQVAHVDGDYTNNVASNLLALCNSHHRLLDNGKINPGNPAMPPFRVGRDGKRRYLGTAR
jgi:hypothetical protein